MMRSRKSIQSALNSKNNLILELMLFEKLWNFFNSDLDPDQEEISSIYRPPPNYVLEKHILQISGSEETNGLIK